MVLWGIVMTCMGLVHDFSGLAACRWFLGMTEAELFPGVNYLGYTSTRANLLSVPLYAAAAIVTVAIGFLADKTRQRGFCNIFVSMLGMVGFAMPLGSHEPGVKYAGVFLGAMGIYACVANTIAWCANNVEGVCKRGITLGFVIGWGSLNGIVSSNIYLARQAKEGYPPGHGVVLAYLCLFLCIGSVLTHFALEAENKKRRSTQRDHWTRGKSASEIDLLGDGRPDFFYCT